ncbi:MAG: hypothetical protein AAF728_13835 [Cyanobacteria bacterium P01_D01_bin.128]
MFLPPASTLQSCRRFLSRLKRPVLSLTLSLGLVGAGLLAGPVEQVVADTEVVLPAQAEVIETPSRSLAYLSDGVYFYGQVPQPGQLGAEYLVFQITNRQAIGAFFSPSSSYDCFHGAIAADQMNLTIIGSYDQTPSQYAIALTPPATLTAAGGNGIVPTGLDGFYAIDTVTAAEREMLATCITDLQPELEI